uniref:Uncharacterized protein n=1 Tax=Chlamydomonas euryale TaxID=1486919 RepID=A0A7R9YTM5_9CHLO
MYRPVSDAEASKHWQFWYRHLETGCMHANKCATRARGGLCNFGSRISNKHIITGAVLPVLHLVLKSVDGSAYGRNSENKKRAPRAIRATTDDGRTVVGLNLHSKDADIIRAKLST